VGSKGSSIIIVIQEIFVHQVPTINKVKEIITNNLGKSSSHTNEIFLKKQEPVVTKKNDQILMS
jgi:hypothetical protein